MFLRRHEEVVQPRVDFDRCRQARKLAQVPRVEDEEPAPLGCDLIRGHEEHAVVLVGAVGRPAARSSALDAGGARLQL